MVLFGALASCEAALTEDAVVGRYIADTTPSLTVTMRPDGTFLEQIDNRQLVGQWRVLRVTRDGPHPFAGDVVELTGLMWSPAGEQTNERIHARLRKMPWRTALEWDAPLVRRLVKQ